MNLMSFNGVSAIWIARSPIWIGKSESVGGAAHRLLLRYQNNIDYGSGRRGKRKGKGAERSASVVSQNQNTHRDGILRIPSGVLIYIGY